MTKLAPEWVRTSDPVIRSPARYRWTTAPATHTMSVIMSSVIFEHDNNMCLAIGIMGKLNIIDSGMERIL